MATLDGAELGELEQRIVDRTAELEIANRKLQREIIERKQTEEEVRLLLAVAQTISEARDFTSALQTTLEKVCNATGWDIGEAWIPSNDDTVLEYGSAVYVNAPQFKTFQNLSKKTTFTRGIGLPGRVWVSKSPEWIPDGSISSGSFCVRRDVALKVGLRAALAIPIVSNDRVLAVLSFFMFQSRDQDKRLVEMISAIALQLGSVIQHKQAEEALRGSESRFALAQEAAAIGTGDWDVQSDKAYWSNHQFYLHGLTPTEDNLIDLQSWVAVVHPDDRLSAVEIIQTAVKSGEGLSTEYRVVWPDKQVRWLRGTARVVRDDNGRAVRMIGVSIDITERKKAEDALTESDERLRTIIDNSPVEIYLKDMAGRHTIVGHHSKKLYGDRQETLIGKTAHDLFPIAEADIFEAHDQAVIEAGRAVEQEYDITFEDGIQTQLAVKFPIFDSNGDISAIGAIVTDITERKRAEEAVRESENRLTLVLDATTEGVYDWNLQTGEVFYSPRWMASLGYSEDEVVPHISFWENIVHPEDMPTVRKHLNDHLQGQTPLFMCENRLRTKSGAYRWNLDRGKVIERGPDGEPIRMVGTDIDLTDYKRSEEARRDSEERFRHAFEQGSLGMAFVDSGGCMVAVNRTFCDLVGYSDHALQGQSVGDITHPDDWEENLDLIGQLFRGDIPSYQVEKRYVHGNGAIVWGRLTATLIHQGYDRQPISFGMIENITERKAAESQLHASHQRLRNLTTQLQAVREEERTIIAREVHDELGQALTALKIDLAWIAKSLPKRWKAVPNRLHSMMSLADSTLTTVRQLSSRLRPAMIDDLGLEAAIEWQLQGFTSRGNYECQTDLKANGLKRDKKRDIAVYRIVQEALTNIARHAGASNIVVKLWIQDKELVLVVKDDGRGISDEALTSAYSLGLTGMYERALSLAGSLKIERGANNNGTNLTLTVPLTAAKQPVFV